MSALSFNNLIMRCNFYLDRPYNPNLDNETIKKEKRRAKERNKKLATKYYNPKPTSVYIFFSPDKNTRIKHRTSIKVYNTSTNSDHYLS